MTRANRFGVRSMRGSRRRLSRGSALPGFVMAALGAGAVLGVGMGVATLVARKVLTPEGAALEDIPVREVSADGSHIVLEATAMSRLPGQYSLWFDTGAGHARVGQIDSEDSRAGTVTRLVESVSYGQLATATKVRLNGWWYIQPDEAGVPLQHIVLSTENGLAPAWLFPRDKAGTAGVSAGTGESEAGAAADVAATTGAATGDANLGERWAIHVHGRGGRRQEALRSISTFHAHGYTSLVVSYRNDGEAPASPDGCYGLGATEWPDVEAALDYAVTHGAKEIVLFGWSMGGAIVLQTLTRARHRERIVGMVLDSPVVDWRETLRQQARVLRIPRPIAEIALRLLGARWALPLLGQAAPLDLSRLDFVRRAGDINVPVLLFASDDDPVVPDYSALSLAATRPDIVTLERFTQAGHTRLWNLDPERWENALDAWLANLV